MAVSEAECRAIVDAVQKNHIIFAVGHVLRYTPYSQTIKQIVDSGRLGRIINIQRLEPVGFWHFAHSYVRGPWKNEKEATFSLLAKSCHDIDWIRWIAGSKCIRVSSFGSLRHFTLSSKPPGAAERCIACPPEIETKCPYSALKIYLEPFQKWNHCDFPLRAIMPDPNNITAEGILHELETGPFGRCVYQCDNDVVDNQIVNLEFANGMTATFTMVAFSEEVCVRKTRIFGTHGELTGNERTIKIFDFRTQKKEKNHTNDAEHSDQDNRTFYG
jgi:predicted dehydrogenase